MKWEPIETAPNYDTMILGWDGEYIDKTWIGWESNGKPVYVHQDWVSWKPTHWMKLPEPPK